MSASSPCVYLAGPIDDVTRKQATGWRTTAAQWLDPFPVYDPTGTAKRCGYDPGTITDVQKLRVLALNREAIRTCGAMIAYLGGPGRGFGTIREIEHARSLRRPVLVVVNPVLVSWETVDVEQLPFLSEACDRVAEIFRARAG